MKYELISKTRTYVFLPSDKEKYYVNASEYEEGPREVKIEDFFTKTAIIGKNKTRILELFKKCLEEACYGL